MSSKSQFLSTMRKKTATKSEIDMSLPQIKDVLISHLQAIYDATGYSHDKEILDIDIPGLQDPARIVIYTKKGGS